MFEQLPNDPIMLLSFVNTQLRDHYTDFSAFIDDFGVNAAEITAKLNSIDYKYDAASNQFV